MMLCLFSFFKTNLRVVAFLEIVNSYQKMVNIKHFVVEKQS